MIDPLTRWAAYGEKPDYAGLMSFAGLPYTEDAAELDGVDVAIVGAPMDELTSDAPGTRFGPRAIRGASCAAGRHLEAGVDALREALRVVDFGDAPILPADPVRSHQAIEATVATVLAAGAVPVVLGGDHSIAEPDIRACAAVHGPVGLIHFDAHTDTGREVFGVELSHGTPDVPARRGRPRRPVALRADRPARLLAGRGGVRLAAARTASPRTSCTTCATAASAPSSPTRCARSAAARCSCRSTSTCSTRPTRPAPARPSPAG